MEWGSTTWTYRKERSFASNYLIFLKILFQFKEPLIESWFVLPTTKIFIFILITVGVWFEGAFSLWVCLIQRVRIPKRLAMAVVRKNLIRNRSHTFFPTFFPYTFFSNLSEGWGGTWSGIAVSQSNNRILLLCKYLLN